MRPRPCPRHRLRAQAGESLISMLVDVVISILTIAGMLALYKSMINVSTAATQTAQRDGQMAAALLAAQMSMQSAGFGVLPANAPLGTKLHIDTNGKRIVWRSANVTSGQSVCSGLMIVDDKQAASRGLYQLEPKECADASDATLTWSADQRHPIAGSAAFFVAAAGSGSGSAGSGLAASTETPDEVGAVSLTTGYKFAREPSRPCLPYMQQTFATAAPSSVVVSMRPESGTGMLFRICLPNLTDTTSP